MNELYLDIGNSFIKWATVINQKYQSYPAVAFEQIVADGLGIFDTAQFDQVYFSAVAEHQKVDYIKTLLQTHWQIIPVQLTSQYECCGLKNGYQKFSDLGDDRWFAMQGAISLTQQSFIVVDAGTAITIDACREGTHLGGLIVPGVHTLRTSLSTQAAGLDLYSDADIEEVDSGPLLPLATSTQAAIVGGTLYMAAAFVNQIVVDLIQDYDEAFQVILTGGDSAILKPLMNFDVTETPDLVLLGMVAVTQSVKKV